MKCFVTVFLMAYFIQQRSVLIKFCIYRYNKRYNIYKKIYNKKKFSYVIMRSA